MSALCDEIAAEAVALVALPAGAPERVRAEAHAATHDVCARALADGRRLLALLGQAPVQAPSAAALQRAGAPILSDFAGTARLAGLVVAMVFAAWAFPLALMRAPLTWGADLGFSIALALLAAGTAAMLMTRGGREAGFVLFLAVLAAAPALGGRGVLAAHVGLHCALTEAATAAAVGLGALLAARLLGRHAIDRPVYLAGLAGGALAGQAALQVGCSVANELPHALAFHTGPVGLAVGLALVLANRAARRAANA